jgi:DNA-binding GntR family transcriptional regulator
MGVGPQGKLKLGDIMAIEAKTIFKPIDEKSLKDRVVMNIRQAIATGIMKPGDRLVEADIATQMDVSRAPVREAIRLLEQEGFVMSIPRKGSFVIELDRQDIEEIYSLRTALESLAVRLAVPRMAPADIDELEALVDEMRQAADEKDVPQLVESDLAFHERIVSLASHGRLLETWLRMSTQLRLFFAIKDQLYDNLRDMVDTHHPILTAVRAGDVELAQQTISEHIVSAGELVLAYLDEETGNIPTPETP